MKIDPFFISLGLRISNQKVPKIISIINTSFILNGFRLNITGHVVIYVYSKIYHKISIKYNLLCHSVYYKVLFGSTCIVAVHAQQVRYRSPVYCLSVHPADCTDEILVNGCTPQICIKEECVCISEVLSNNNPAKCVQPCTICPNDTCNQLFKYPYPASRESKRVQFTNKKKTLSLFVCVEVLRPNQPNWVMSSAVSLPSHTFTGQA